MARRRTALLTLVTTSALIVAVAGSSARALASASAAPALSSSAPALVHGALFNGAEIVPNQVIVRFAAGTSSAGRRAAVRAEGAAIAEPLSLPRTELVELADGTSVEDAIAAFEENPDVTYAEPNYVSQLSAIPNDTNFAQLWGLNQVSDKDIDAPEAWDLTTGNSSIIVAVIDSGVAYDHPDLAANIWTNDDPAGGGDQDGNGFVDDTNGWDFVANDNAPLDANEHGTHVAGTIGARGNNALGVTGVNWQASIMPLRAGNASGSLTDAAIIDAIVYACANGARVVNGSFGGGGFSQATLNAIDSVACANTLFVFAAGNGGSDGIGDNNDTTPEYPCNYNTTRIVCVAATDQNDARAFFSNFGATNVDLAAPGVGIFSSMPTFVNVLSDGFEDTPTLFNTRWGGQAAPTGHPLWGPQNFVYAGGGAFSLSDSPAGNYSANTDTHIRSLTGSNLSGRAGCSLGYNMHLATEPLLDGVTIEASTAFAGTYTDVSQGGWSGTTGPFFFGFQEDLGAFDGQASVFLRFRLRSNGTNQFDGAHIDDISLNCVTTPSAPGNYQNLTGTSMAAPHVAGAAALVLARNPALTTAQVRTILLSTVDPIAGLSVASGGRLNVGSAVAAVDVVAPQTTIDTGPSGPTNDSTPTFTFSSSEPGTFQCRVDASAFAACTSPHTTAVLADGAHTFEVRATDLAANTDPTPASRTFTVDTAVQTQIDSGPSGLTNDSTPTFAFSSEPGATFECRVDTGSFAACTSPHTTSELVDGPHTFDVRATDLDGNTDPTPATRSFTVDTTPAQTQIDSGPSGPTNDSTPTFTFSSEAGATFQCRSDGEPFAACTSPHTTSILGEGAHTFDVRATDQAANTDPTPANRSFTVDTVVQTQIDSGPSGLTNDSTPTFTFSSEAGATFQCRTDADPFAACSSPHTTSILAEGARTFEVRATDPAGNTDPTPASRSVTVDTTPPPIPAIVGPGGTVATTDATFAFSSEAGASFECRLDGTAFAACASPDGFTGLAQGAHSFQVRATDTAGNTSAAASRAWSVDTTAPNTTITGGPPARTTNKTATVKFKSTEANSTFKCKLDKGAWTACKSPKTYRNLKKGSHTFQVAATDKAGNADKTPAKRTWTIT